MYFSANISVSVQKKETNKKKNSYALKAFTLFFSKLSALPSSARLQWKNILSLGIPAGRAWPVLFHQIQMAVHVGLFFFFNNRIVWWSVSEAKFIGLTP